MILYHQSGVIILFIEKAPSKDFKPFNDANLTYVLFFQSVVCFNFSTPSFVNCIRKLYSRYFLQSSCNNFCTFNWFSLKTTLLLLTTFLQKSFGDLCTFYRFLCYTKKHFPQPSLLVQIISKNRKKYTPTNTLFY